MVLSIKMRIVRFFLGFPAAGYILQSGYRQAGQADSLRFRPNRILSVFSKQQTEKFKEH